MAGRIRAVYGRDSTVVYPPVDAEFYTPSGQLREDFYLVVGALAPYKRVDQAMEAFRRLLHKTTAVIEVPNFNSDVHSLVDLRAMHAFLFAA